MTWTVALGLGMWMATWLRDCPTPLPFLMWGVLGSLHVLLPLAEWRRVVLFVLAGWTFGIWNLKSSELAWPVEGNESPLLLCLGCQPTFTPSVGRTMQHGTFFCRDGLGHKGLLWLSMPDTAIRTPGSSWVQVTRPRTFDRSDPFDFSAHLSSLGVRSRGMWLGRPDSTFWDSEFPTRGNTLAERWRAWLKQKFVQDKSGLVLGMFAGDKKCVDREVQTAMRRLGLAHLLAVSGYHVSLVSLLFFFLLQMQQRFLRVWSVAGVAMVWTFVAATGWSLSAIRAAVMVSFGWWFWVRGRSLSPWGLLGAAACVVAAIEPLSPCQLGAQLSFAATSALIALKGNHLAWRVPIRAQWATLPWNVHDFQTFPVLFYPANLLAAVAVWGFACCVAGAGFGFEWFTRGLEAMGEGALMLSNSVNSWEGLNWNVGWIDRAGLSPLVWGTAMLWMCPLLRGQQRRVWVRNAMCLAVMAGTWVNLRSNNTSSTRRPAHRLWHVSARTPTWLLEDGWRGVVWTASTRDSANVANLVHHLGLSHVEWNTTHNGPNASKSQPPREVWDFGQNPGGTCEVTLGRKISSVSEAE